MEVLPYTPWYSAKSALPAHPARGPGRNAECAQSEQNLLLLLHAQLSKHLEPWNNPSSLAVALPYQQSRFDKDATAATLLMRREEQK